MNYICCCGVSSTLCCIRFVLCILVAGLGTDDERDIYEQAAAQLDTLDVLAEECVVLSSALVSSLADIPNGQHEHGEAPEPHPYGSPIRRSSTVRRVEDVCTPAAAPPASRRRLRGKQSVATSDSSPASSTDCWNFLSQITSTQSMTGDKGLGRRLYSLLREVARKQWESTVGLNFECPAGVSLWAAKRDAQRIWFAKTSKKAKAKMARTLATTNELPPDMQEYVRTLEDVKPTDNGRTRIQGKCVSLTYNGDWGIVQIPVPADYSSEQGLRNFISTIKAHPAALKLWRLLEAWSVDICKGFSLFRISQCIELSIHTLSEGIVRLHVHACLEREAKFNVRVTDAGLSFLGSAPYCKVEDMFTRSQRSGGGRNTNQAHYYIQGPKTSKIFSSGKQAPFVDYSVKSEWISSRVQDGKFSLECCREEFVKCGRNVRENLANLDIVTQERTHLAMREHISEVQRRLRLSRMPVHTYEQVENFHAEFATEKDRRPLLVINGPSGLGKTTFVRSWCEPDEILELSCEGMLEPDLREVKFNKTRVVLLDECSATLILSYKKVFMGSPALVTLGSSKTGCYSYKVWTHGVKFVICTNRWLDEVQALKPSDQQWLQRNTILLQVDACMYIDS